MTRPDPAFEAPWHAQVFALTVHLNETGLFDWSDWASAFGATLKQHGLAKELNGGEDYFTAWLATLEQVLSEREIASPAQTAVIKDAWELAYLSTPHGAPVVLKTAG